MRYHPRPVPESVRDEWDRQRITQTRINNLFDALRRAQDLGHPIKSEHMKSGVNPLPYKGACPKCGAELVVNGTLSTGDAIMKRCSKP